MLNKVVSTRLATFPSNRGKLTVVESGKHIGFTIARIFYIYAVPKDCERGGHAHRESAQAFIGMSGRCCLELSDGKNTQVHQLDCPARVIYVPPLIWVRLHGFTEDAICLVMASALYDANDYIHEWDEYLSIVASGIR